MQLRQGVDALIDPGALLAGAELSACRSAVAAYVLQHTPADSRFRGVSYFSAEQGWVIADCQGRVEGKAESNLKEAETFAVFDDARTRGADLKLRQDASALLTLAPGMTRDKLTQAAGRLRQRDKLTQAAGRLRQLGRGQTLRVVGLRDVTAAIAAAAAGGAQPSGGGSSNSSSSSSRGGGLGPASSSHAAGEPQPSMRAVAAWVEANTQAAVLAGVVEHAAQGVHFASTAGAPAELAKLPERLELADLYASSQSLTPAAAVIAATAEREIARVSSSAAGLSERQLSEAAQRIQQVQQRSQRLAEGHQVVSGARADEECERELQQEQDKEEERQLELQAATPANEADWLWPTAFSVSSAAQLQGQNPGLRLLQLSEVVRLLGPVAASSGLDSVAFAAGVLATHNFVHSVVHSAAASGSDDASLSSYLRPVDAALLLPSGELVLLSEREADALQHTLWTGGPGGSALALRAATPSSMLLSLGYISAACEEAAQGGSSQALPQPGLLLAGVPAGAGPPLALAQQLRQRLNIDRLVSAQLFAGCVRCGSDAQRAMLRKLVRGKREAAQELVALRGRESWFARSDLARAAADDEF